MKQVLVIISVAAVSLMLAAVAFAGGSVLAGHNPTPPAATKLSSNGTPPSSASGGSLGTLPFTGLDLAGIVSIGVALTGAGFILRRTARR